MTRRVWIVLRFDALRPPMAVAAEFPPALTLRIIPLTLEQANNLVARLHRHRPPCVSHRFSIGVVDENGNLRGAAIVGRAVAPNVDQNNVAEVSRLVTDGTPNACSILYGATARVARDMGFEKIQTYILQSELGTSLKASGWVDEGATDARGGRWHYREGRSDSPGDQCSKKRYVRVFATKTFSVEHQRSAA
jgi:hypothetical protein